MLWPFKFIVLLFTFGKIGFNVVPVLDTLSIVFNDWPYKLFTVLNKSYDIVLAVLFNIADLNEDVKRTLSEVTTNVSNMSDTNRYSLYLFFSTLTLFTLSYFDVWNKLDEYLTSWITKLGEETWIRWEYDFTKRMFKSAVKAVWSWVP